MNSIASADGGIIIIPAGFFLSPRDIDVRCRHAFMMRFRILHVRYFEQTVFPDTTTTVVAFNFVRAVAQLNEQTIDWEILPRAEHREFTTGTANDWIIGGDIYKYRGRIPIDGRAQIPLIRVRRFVVGDALTPGEQQTFMTLNALDSGSQDGRIKLVYEAGTIYQAKESSRAYATLCIVGANLTEPQQIAICARFNALIEEKRAQTWSLFLPQYRESKEYARKRIPFDLAYHIITELVIDEITQQ